MKRSQATNGRSRYLLVLATACLIRTVGIIRAHDCLATLGALGSLGFSIGVYAVFVELGTTEDHVATDKCFLALFTLGCLGDFITLGTFFVHVYLRAVFFLKNRPRMITGIRALCPLSRHV